MAILQYEYKGFDVVIMAGASTPDVNISSRNPRLREKLGGPFITFKAPNIEMARAMAEERIDAHAAWVRDRSSSPPPKVQAAPRND